MIWERRWHPILNEWIIISSQTGGRPWNGAIIENFDEKLPEFDPHCYLCPGVKRASGEVNPDYKETYVFDNDFASFGLSAPLSERNDAIFKAERALGVCRVVCFNPNHNVVIAQLSSLEIEKIIRVWINEFSNLSKIKEIKNILIFENKGKVIGVSNPHPHGQIYATGFIPRILEQEIYSSKKYFQEKSSCLFCNVLSAEKNDNKRLVVQNDSFTVFLPYFARFSYETYIFSNRHFPRIIDLTEKEIRDFADILRRLFCKYDNLFGMILPNIMMTHNAPVNGDDHDSYFHFHLEFYPPLRTPDKLKYLAGFESGGNIINPSDPDYSAEQLRRASEVHFRNNEIN